MNNLSTTCEMHVLKRSYTKVVIHNLCMNVENLLLNKNSYTNLILYMSKKPRNYIKLTTAKENSTLNKWLLKLLFNLRKRDVYSDHKYIT